MEYKKIVKELLNIQWQGLKTRQQLTELMFLSLVTAIEFSESLRIALRLYPKNENLKKMAMGELNTNNLLFSDYNGYRDHWFFLMHFLVKKGIVNYRGWKFEDRLNQISKKVFNSALIYTQNIDKELSETNRAMSIFSREEELSKIFSNMLAKIPVFQEEDLPEHLLAFKYYLQAHIELDSEEGGHKDLVSEFEVNDDLKRFYGMRLNLYHNAFPDLHIII